MTHEEVVTFHVANAVKSHRQLPMSLYHFQVKERDEPRPRAGVLRTREFIMKDSYSFDADFEGLQVSYDKHAGAYGMGPARIAAAAVEQFADEKGISWPRAQLEGVALDNPIDAVKQQWHAAP